MKIAIVNVHWNNRGDEAALFAVLQGVRKLHPIAEITLILKDTKAIVQFPEVEGLQYFAGQFKARIWDIWLSAISRGQLGFNTTLKQTVKILKRSDLIIYGPGGSVINDRFFWRKQMEYLLPFICARLYRVPLFVAAPSIGPFDSDKPNRIRQWLLKTPQVMCVREEISREYLAEIDVRDNVHVTIDSAFMDDVDISGNEKKLINDAELNEFLTKNDKVLGITITDFKWHVKYSKDSELLERIEKSFFKLISKLESQGYGVVLIPQLFGNQNDSDYLQKYQSKNVFIMSELGDAYFQQYVISKLYAVIGMRYHSNIFAAKMGTPFVSVIYEEKMEGFLDLAELNEYSFPLQEISPQLLEDKLDLLVANHEEIQKKLQMKRGEWKRQAERTIELLSTVS
jgi:colanic acid/amylovoran biosynthesis protein